MDNLCLVDVWNAGWDLKFEAKSADLRVLQY